MKTTLLLAFVGLITINNAIDLKSMDKITNQTSVKSLSQDGPTNGEMSEDEKDTLIQVLCPGNVVTSFSQTAGKSSTCNAGGAAAKKASFVQTEETAGED